MAPHTLVRQSKKIIIQFGSLPKNTEVIANERFSEKRNAHNYFATAH
jgi:hypothetical protein